MPYPPAAADPVDAGLPDGGMPAAGKGGGAGGKPSAGGTDPSAPGGSQSNGQTGQKGRITGEPGGARVLYFKKERDE